MQIWIQLIFKTMSVASSHDAMQSSESFLDSVLLYNYSALKSIGTHQRFTHLVVVLGHVLCFSHTMSLVSDLLSPACFLPAWLCATPSLQPHLSCFSLVSPEYSFRVSFPGSVCHRTSVLLLPALISCVWNLSPGLTLCPPWGLALHLDLFC